MTMTLMIDVLFWSDVNDGSCIAITMTHPSSTLATSNQIIFYASQIKKKQEDYYKHFPTSSMNVIAKETVHGQTVDGKTMIRRGLTVTKAFKAGDLIQHV